MTDSRFGFGIFLSFFFILLILTVCAPLNSAFDSERDLPFCEQQQCDQCDQEYGRCRAIANKMPNGTRNVIGHLTTDLGPVRATRKKNNKVFLEKSDHKISYPLQMV